MSDLCSRVFLHFYDIDGTTRRDAVLEEAHSFRFSEELAADGVLTFQVPRTAAALVADPDLLEDGICKVALVLTAGAAPTEVLAFELVPTSGTVVADDPASEQITVTAPGVRNLLSYAVLFPETDAGYPPGWDNTTGDERIHGWMSIDTTAWYDSADWSTPLSYGAVDSKLWTGLGGAQKITADLTPAVGDENLFRAEFFLTVAQRVRIFWLGDDEVTVFVDSELLGESGPGAQTHINDLHLPAGGHTIAAICKNTIGSELKFACIITSLTAAAKPSTVLRRTDTTHWKVHKVSGAKPGWTPGGILVKLVQEAQDPMQDAYGSGFFAPDFTKTLDSAGVAWSEMPEKGFLVGQTTLLDVVRELEELECDVRVKADGTLQAFITQGTDVSGSVWLQKGSNLLGLTYVGTAVRATKALVRCLAGWVQSTNSAGVTAWGKRYMGVTAGTVASSNQAARLGVRALEETASPRYVYTAKVRAVAGAVPFGSFRAGDTITCPDRVGDATAMRVLSITGSTPEGAAGPVTFDIEMDAP